MLFVIHRANNPELTYQGGQAPIVHLVASLRGVVQWANRNGRRWAFTTSNAGSRFFDDFADLEHLDKIDWDAVKATQWRDCKEEKQAEFLIERYMPWELISRIGVMCERIRQRVNNIVSLAEHRPAVEIKRNWYY